MRISWYKVEVIAAASQLTPAIIAARWTPKPISIAAYSRIKHRALAGSNQRENTVSRLAKALEVDVLAIMENDDVQNVLVDVDISGGRMRKIKAAILEAMDQKPELDYPDPHGGFNT